MPEKGKARAGEMALGLKVHTALAKDWIGLPFSGKPSLETPSQACPDVCLLGDLSPDKLTVKMKHQIIPICYKHVR